MIENVMRGSTVRILQPGPPPNENKKEKFQMQLLIYSKFKI